MYIIRELEREPQHPFNMLVNADFSADLTDKPHTDLTLTHMQAYVHQ